jgi:hypothetical protein
VLVRLAQSQHRVARLAAPAGLLLIAALAAGCHRQPVAEDTSGVRMTAHVLPAQPVVGPATVTVTMNGATAATLGSATVDVVAHMTHPGMTPVVATVTPHGPDVYEAALDFTMAGDWMLIATVRLHDGRRLESRIPVRVQPRP